MKSSKLKIATLIVLVTIIAIIFLLNNKQNNYNLEDKIGKYDLNVYRNKEKFRTNLLEHFNLIISDDCESDCLLNREEQKLTVEVYGDFKNTEPTKGKTHHFHYTLDSEGNVDDAIFEYTE